MRIFRWLTPVFAVVCALAAPAPDSAGNTVTINLLATTDLHGNLLPYDYFTATEAPRGLARLATIIKKERAQNPNTLLIDCGDTIQGSPLEGYYQEHFKAGTLPAELRGGDPMMLAMNSLGYDSMTVGNHEFNYGLKNLDGARSTAKFPWISANIAATGDTKPFASYIVKTIAGIKVAVVGITTPAIPNWEKPENYAGYEFRPGPDALRETVARLRSTEKPDVIVVATHSGLGSDLRTGNRISGDLPGENMADELAKVSGVDVVFFGHTHSQLAEGHVGETLLVQPKNWGMSLGVVELKLERGAEGRWRIASKLSRLVAADRSVPEDPEVARIAVPYHTATEAFLNTPVTRSAAELTAARSRVEDTAIIDAVQQVELFYSHADVSFASSFNLRAVIPKGQVTNRQLAALYVYDNELYAIEGTGRMVKDALENSARFFNSCADSSCSGRLVSGKVFGYNFDIAAGVSYEIDLTRPAGDRIRNLTWKGKPLAPDQKLRIALNNYRAAGSGGYTMFTDAKIIWRSYDPIRDLMVRYYSSGHNLPEQPDGNWRIVPKAAEETLERSAREELAHPSNQ